MTSQLAGRDVTLQLINLLRKSGLFLTTASDEEHARAMKEKCCGIVVNETQKNDQYVLPDGKCVELRNR